MRECPFRNCPERLPDQLFACKRHWFTLTQAQRQTIHAAYADYLGDKIGVDELRRVQQQVLDNVPGGPHHA